MEGVDPTMLTAPLELSGPQLVIALAILLLVLLSLIDLVTQEKPK